MATRPKRPKRPTPRFKSAKAQADMRTKAAKRRGLIPRDVRPSRSPAARHGEYLRHKARHPHDAAKVAAKKRAQRVLITGDPNGDAFKLACLRLCKSTDPADQMMFYLEQKAKRLGFVFIA